MPDYQCCDGDGDEVTITADDHESAARDYVDGCDYEEHDATWWCHVTVSTPGEDDDVSHHVVAVDPPLPDCKDDASHDWCSPHEVVGGIEDNPGVWGHGGGVVITEVCRHCARYRVTDTWAQDPVTGAPGLQSIEYRESDEASRGWDGAKRAQVEAMLRPRAPREDPESYRMLALDEMVRALGVEEDPLLPTAEALLHEEMESR